MADDIQTAAVRIEVEQVFMAYFDIPGLVVVIPSLNRYRMLTAKLPG